MLNMCGKVLSIGIALGYSMSISNAEEFASAVRPVLAKHCFGCHNAKVTLAKLNLEAVSSSEATVWEKVREKVSSGLMPPLGQPRLARGELSVVTKWLDATLKPIETKSEPGRVMARRLNRVEYNNTLRDLLGVAARPADEFPVDDSGYGFDNVADVLTLSPMLMEKYMTAAHRVSRLAVFGETIPDKPTRLVRLLNRRSPDASDVLSSGGFAAYLPYSMRGAMYGSWTFPVDGEYEFRLRIANFRAPGTDAPPRKLVLSVDGTPVLTDVVEGTTTVGYDRGEFIARIAVKAGERPIRASYPELADLADPRQNINKDKRRGLFIDYLEIVGPYNRSAEPSGSYRRIFTCGHSTGKHLSQCGRSILKSFLPKAYRRPVTPREIEDKLRLVALAKAEGDSFEEGIRLALEAVLASPDFLFRIERDPTPGASPTHLVKDHELASRLSYFLWSSMPDDELRLAAQSGLRRPGALQAQVKRMLADQKASNLVDNFAAQWLQLRNLGRTKPDLARFPTFDDELLDAMRRETSLFVAAIFQEDRSILDFIDGPFTFLNGPLARHYGIEGISGEEFRRVDLQKVERRSGLLTQGAILTVSSYPTRTSPPVRGKWVLENLLGSAPPPPPADVPVLDESQNSGTISLRARMEQHRKDPSCSACHVLMDPIGFGLESYDAVGSWRTHDGQVPIDTSGVLPDGRTFRGASDLKQILRSQSEPFARNFTEKLLTFALGRGLESYDRPAVEDVVKRAATNDFKFSTFVLGIVNSQPFQMRSQDKGKS